MCHLNNSSMIGHQVFMTNFKFSTDLLDNEQRIAIHLQGVDADFTSYLRNNEWSVVLCYIIVAWLCQQKCVWNHITLWGYKHHPWGYKYHPHSGDMTSLWTDSGKIVKVELPDLVIECCLSGKHLRNFIWKLFIKSYEL